MTAQTSDLARLSARLDRLERELCWWRRGALGAVLLLVALGAAPRSTTLEGERLVIRDAKGTVRAALGLETEKRGWPSLPTSPGVPKEAPKFGLYLYREDGVEAARLNLDAGEPQLVLADRQQKSFARMGAFRGLATVEVTAREKGLAEFGAELEALVKRGERERWSANDERWGQAEPPKEGASLDLTAMSVPLTFRVSGHSEGGRFSLLGGAISPMVSLTREPWGSALDIFPNELRLTGRDGKNRVLLALSDDESPFLALHDKAGRSRAVLGSTELETIRTGTVERRAESSLVLFDKDGKVLWRAP